MIQTWIVVGYNDSKMLTYDCRETMKFLSVGWLVLRRINPFRVILRQIKFRTIQFSISNVFVYKQLNVKKSST